ncbi:MAG: OmpA family protein [Elusimicrobiota bacterium]
MAIYKFRKDELDNALNKNAIWAIVYGDMMSYLMILFLMMLSYSISKDIDRKSKTFEEALNEVQVVFGGKIDKKVADRIQARDKEFVYIETMKQGAEDGKFGDEASVIVSELSIQLNLGSGILFDSGEATLKQDALPKLEVVAKNMLNVKNEIRVEGHTDSVPIGKRMGFKSNWELSMARAYSVIRALEGFGVDPKRLSGVGYGEHRPAGDNSTAAGRSQNRRISIDLLRIGQ